MEEPNHGIHLIGRVPHRLSGGGLIRTPGDVGSCRDTEWLIRPPALKGSGTRGVSAVAACPAGRGQVARLKGSG